MGKNKKKNTGDNKPSPSAQTNNLFGQNYKIEDPKQNDDLNYFKIARIIVDVAPKLMRKIIESSKSKLTKKEQDYFILISCVDQTYWNEDLNGISLNDILDGRKTTQNRTSFIDGYLKHIKNINNYTMVLTKDMINVIDNIDKWDFSLCCNFLKFSKNNFKKYKLADLLIARNELFAHASTTKMTDDSYQYCLKNLLDCLEDFDPNIRENVEIKELDQIIITTSLKVQVQVEKESYFLNEIIPMIGQLVTANKKLLVALQGISKEQSQKELYEKVLYLYCWRIAGLKNDSTNRQALTFIWPQIKHILSCLNIHEKDYNFEFIDLPEFSNYLQGLASNSNLKVFLALKQQGLKVCQKSNDSFLGYLNNLSVECKKEGFVFSCEMKF